MANFKVKALFEYSSSHDDDLQFGVGQIITVTEEEDADWYCGEYIDEAGKKHEGIFPRNFVEKYEPTAPPRPTRSRGRKDTEPAVPAEEPNFTRAPASEVTAEEDAAARQPPPLSTIPAPPVVPAPPAEPPASSSLPASRPAAPEASAPPPPPLATASSHVRKLSASQAKPAAPPPVSEKPSLSSFRDRIAAFNKPAAPPVAPFKPGGLGPGTGGTGFVKKPFVAPPPSRNAYVPPTREAPATKLYRREEDPEIKEMEAETMENAEKAGLVPGKLNEAVDDDDQPKPTSLKERIALLQKQQMEAAQRHAEAVAAKPKPKKPPVKSRSMSSDRSETMADPEAAPPPLPIVADTESTGRKSVDEPHMALLPASRKMSKGPYPEPGDGNEADMSGAGDVTEGLEDLAEKDESDAPYEKSGVPIDNEDEVGDQDEGNDEQEDDDIDPEVRRKEELRARMAKMSGGMGMAGMFGMVPMPAPAPSKKKPAAQPAADQPEDEAPFRAPPVPAMMMALPGMPASRRSDEMPREDLPQAPLLPPPPPTARPATSPGNDEGATESDVMSLDATPRRSLDAPPPIPGNRPAPPPVPLELRSPPPPPPAELTSQRSGSESDDELSEQAHGRNVETPKGEVPPRIRSPPPPIPLSPGLAGVARSPPFSSTALDDLLASPPTSPRSKRNSRPPPPPPGVAPAAPPGNRPPPPPPPPPPGAAPLSRQSTADGRLASPARITSRPANDDEDEVTEYEGDYDTDIGSSVPHKDALKSNHHARGSSVDDSGVFSPLSDPQPAGPAAAAAPRAAPPPVPAQGTPESARRSMDATRRSVEVPRAAPPPPPSLDEYDPFNYTAQPAMPAAGMYQPMPPKIDEEDASATESGPLSPSLLPRSSAAAASTPQPPNWTGTRASMDAPKTMIGNRRSVDIGRPSTDSGFIAEDIELAPHSGWWKQPNQAPPALQGRRDVYYESRESTTTNHGTKTIVTRETRILYLDYSQTIIKVQFDPYDQSDVDITQSHEPPPRALRQDQLEQAYERFGMHIAEAVAGKKDTVVGDGTSLGLVHDLLRPWKDVLAPVGTRAFGSLVYANLANASTQQNDEIRKGDIITIRNAKFQGKHGPMHAKYSVEVGKPDHVAVIAEWDGTKKKVRAYEQGRESRKVKIESFKLDDLRSGEVKIWRVMPRSWIGWNVQA